MISAATLNSELINKIAQDFAQATSLAVVVMSFFVVALVTLALLRRGYKLRY